MIIKIVPFYVFSGSIALVLLLYYPFLFLNVYVVCFVCVVGERRGCLVAHPYRLIIFFYKFLTPGLGLRMLSITRCQLQKKKELKVKNYSNEFTGSSSRAHEHMC